MRFPIGELRSALSPIIERGAIYTDAELTFTPKHHVIEIDDYGRINRRKTKQMKRVLIDPQENYERDFAKDAGSVNDPHTIHLIDDFRERDVLSVLLTFNNRQLNYNVIHQTEPMGVRVLEVVRSKARDDDVNQVSIDPYKTFHKEMMERLNAHIVAQSEDISALELPFIIFEELQTDFEKRYQIYKNLVRTNAVSYTHLTLPTTPYV